MLEYILQKTEEYIAEMPKAVRKKYGQFFTSRETARYMASLFDAEYDKKNYVSVVDTGAGSGILSAALIERFNKSNIKTMELTCYENDENILPILSENLKYMQKKANFTVNYFIIKDNYIISQSGGFTNALGSPENPQKYDIVVGNPPYMKIPRNASEALAMPEVCHGAPNLYFLFAAMALFNLKENGEMVYIMPRSWTSGAYFRAFRKYFLSNGKLEAMHLFISRDKVFEKENVLQETMIVKVCKTKMTPGSVKITSSASNHDFADLKSIHVPYSLIVSGKSDYVYLATSEEDVKVLEKVNRFKKNLPANGMKMKTGLTVDFRERGYLRNEPDERTIPMFFAQHIKDGKIVYPCGKNGEYLLPDKKSLTQKNSNYLFVKRFTAKEEPRRLQCGIYIAGQFAEYKIISTQNKLNFIDNVSNNLSMAMVYGLYVLFNSKLYDRYYRILNGSTQVNSTEINTMPVPDKSVIEAMGQILITQNDLSESICDRILEDYLNEDAQRCKKIS